MINLTHPSGIKLHKVEYFMAVAKLTSELSYSNRKKVGAVFVHQDRIILTGYNGTAPGTCNCCEDSDGNTEKHVFHAEENGIIFAARHGLSLENSTLFTTMSPCSVCARLIYGAGIKSVIYSEIYRDTDGIKFLESVNLPIYKY